MSIFILPREEQVESEFNGGAILENKPIGFPQEGGLIKPYSNLFYWANAVSENGSLLGEHPHRGFEILTFVLQGKIEHYDSKTKDWIPLIAGDAQIIRSGSGITHAENFFPASRIFQIWFDPGIERTLNIEPSYNDYRKDSFPIIQKDTLSIKYYKGNNAPIEMLSENIEIYEIQFSKGIHIIETSTEMIYSAYQIFGSIHINGYILNQNDFFIAKNEESLNIEANSDGKLFMISTPTQMSYKTYYELTNR